MSIAKIKAIWNMRFIWTIFIKDVSHPTDPDDGGVDIKGWGPESIKGNLLPALQKEGKIEVLSERQIRITQKGKDFCNKNGI
jgi:hypothetical protein